MACTVAVMHLKQAIEVFAVNDKLHEPARLIPDYEELQQVAKLARACAF